MTGEVVVREGRTEDVAAVLRMERAVVGAPHWVAGVYGAMVAGEAETASGGGVVRRLVVAEEGAELAGFAVASVMGAGEVRWGELESVVVGERWRRQGVGSRMCEDSMRWCAAMGARWMELEVRAGGAGAQRMYGELGFAEVGRRRGYYQNPEEDAVMMRAELGAGGQGRP